MGVRPIPKSLMLCVTTGTHCSYTQEHTEIASYTVARFAFLVRQFSRYKAIPREPRAGSGH
jgi:hypothetical protein